MTPSTSGLFPSFIFADTSLLKAAIDSRFEEVDKKIEAASLNYDDVSIKFSELERDIEAANKLVAEVDEKIAGIDPTKSDKILEALRQFVTTSNQNFIGLKTEQESLKQEIESLKINIAPKSRSDVAFTSFWKSGDTDWNPAWLRVHDFLRETYLKKSYDGVQRGDGPQFGGFQNTAGAACPPLKFDSETYLFKNTLFFHPKVSYDGNGFEYSVFRFEPSDKYLKDNHTWWGTKKKVCGAIIDGLIDSDQREWDGRGISIKGIKFHTIDDEYAPLSILGYQTNLRLKNVHIANRDSTGLNRDDTGYYKPGNGIISAPVQDPIQTPWGKVIGSFYGQTPNTWLMDPVFEDVFVEGTDVGFWLNGGAGIRMSNCGCYFTKQGFYLKNVRYSYVNGFLFNTEDVGFDWKDKTLAGILTGRSNSVGNVVCAPGREVWEYDQTIVDQGGDKLTLNDFGWHGKKGVEVLGIRK